MKTIIPAQGGFLARIQAPDIEATGVFPTREAADAAANAGLDQIARRIAPRGRHDLTAEGIQPRLIEAPRPSPRGWIERQMAAPMRPKGKQRKADHGLFNRQGELL